MPFISRSKLREVVKRHARRIMGFPPSNYDWDGLKVYWKNTDFLNDEHFMSAYRAGMNSGHKIGGPADGQVDLHIEWRVLVACWAACHAKHLSGDFVECGVNTGMLSLAVCNYIDFNATGKSFYLFDTYCGIPGDQLNADEIALNRLEWNAQYEECYEIAKRNFAPFPKATLVRGRVPETLTSVPIDRVCYLSLDMNIATPEVAAIEYFWEKLVVGAPVVLDDYGWLNNVPQKRALDEFAAREGVKVLTLPTGQGLLLKP